MKHALRVIASVVLLAAAAFVAYRAGYTPYRCNIVARTVAARTEYLASRPVDAQLRIINTRDNLLMLDHCLKAQPADVQLHMIAGANYALRDDSENALAHYETALRFDRRSEIYMNVGLTQLDLGHTDDARRSLVTACLARPASLDDIPLPMRDDVSRSVEKVRAELEGRAAARLRK